MELVQVFLYVYCPWVLLAFLNSSTVYALLKRKRDAIRKARVDHGSDRDDEDGITKMLLLTTLLFVVLFLPRGLYTLVWDVAFVSKELTKEQLLIRDIHFKIARFFSNVNHAANFYMYLIPCKRFRRNLFELFGLRSTEELKSRGDHTCSSVMKRVS
jgi:hypothetical protein